MPLGHLLLMLEIMVMLELQVGLLFQPEAVLQEALKQIMGVTALVLVAVAALFQAEQEVEVLVGSRELQAVPEQIMAETGVLEFVVVAVVVDGEMALEEVLIMRGTEVCCGLLLKEL